MRHLFVVVDASSPMSDQDLKPWRLKATTKLLEYFVEEYFDQNPISQLGLLSSQNKRAEKITELGGNPRRHINALQELSSKTCQGEFSLQNSLDLALSHLRHMPSHASREVLIVMGSLTTCDPGDVRESIKAMAEANIRCSVIGLSAEVRVCKFLCQQTGGSYNVILDESHFKDLLVFQVTPPPSSVSQTKPSRRINKENKEKGACLLFHLDSQTSQGFSSSGYFCPQCKSKYCELPVECKACSLTLVSAPHLARSYHHLFPPDAYREVLTSDILTDGPVYICDKCEQKFCLDCDLFTHETLHSCPGCASFRSLQNVQATTSVH
ncbi:hypothetical protein EGW08_018680 [Elysia chlorotica]|uniref:General transcription factor IIH subunit n=1 Tax=Elysia chlorotica TaxID=188477 RepID=A0A433SW86_ELYCH|nr:hypothetical protein EGW08_018680 [Elysia chlorotica]